MAPLAYQRQPRELVFHNFPNALPEFVPANHVEAYLKLRRAFRYLNQQFSSDLPRMAAQSNVDARCKLIQLSELCLSEAALDRDALQGNLIESITETVDRCEGRRTCRTRGEK